MTDLIGMQFKRNVYGPSIWTDIVKETRIRWKFEKPYNGIQTPEVIVIGENTGKIGLCFPLSELIFLRPLDFGQKLQLNKCELHQIIKDEWLHKQKSKKE